MKGVLLAVIALFVAFSAAKNFDLWAPEKKPVDDRPQVSDTIITLEMCANIEQNPGGTCNKTIEDLHAFVKWAYHHKDTMIGNNTMKCGDSPTKIRSPFAESCTRRYDLGERYTKVVFLKGKLNQE